MSTTVLEEGKPLTQVIYSNVKALTEQAQYIFDTLLNNSVPAEQRIRELEDGIMPEVIETMRETDRTQKLAFDLIRSARREVLIIFSTANAFHRQVRAGTVPLVRDLAEKYNVRVKIMTPVDNRIEALARDIRSDGHAGILLRYLEPSLQGVSILIVDRKYSLAVELKDDSKESTLDAIGLATYSNSKPLSCRTSPYLTACGPRTSCMSG